MSFYKDDEYYRVIEAWTDSMTKEEGKTFEEVAISVLGQKRWDELVRLQQEWDDENLLFKVCHPDGTEWTYDEIEQWVLDKKYTQLIYCDIDGFYLDNKGNLLLADECGNYEYVDQQWFQLKFNKKPVETLLKNLNKDE